jgi:2'-5' RNA ligase
MESGSYAVVAYLNGALAGFVESLRSRLAPEQTLVRPHLTLLSPRALEIPREKLISAFKRICYNAQPVAISLDEVQAFVPVTSTVYLQIHQGSDRICDLHQRLNQYGFRAEEAWPYVPHVTLATLADHAVALQVLQEARMLWSRYSGPREFMVKELTLVRESVPGRWDDLDTVALASTVAP